MEVRLRAPERKIYRVKYSDGDLEDLTQEDMDGCIIIEKQATGRNNWHTPNPNPNTNPNPNPN